jgi:hypothetical protein
MALVSGFAKSLRLLETAKTFDASVKNLVVETIDNPILKSFFRDVNFTMVQKLPHLNDVPLTRFSNLLKLSKFDEAFRAIDNNFKVTPEVTNYLRRNLDQLPEFYLASSKQLAEGPFAKFKDVVDVDEFTTMLKADPKLDADITKKVLEKTSNGKLVTKTLIVGVAGLTVYGAINKVRKELGGCIRYTRTDFGLEKCKVIQGSCLNNLTSESIRTCKPEELTPSQRLVNCAETPTNVHCKRCDSTETNVNNPNYIPDRENIPDNVYFKCYEASYAEALGDIVDDLSEGAIETVENSLEFVKNLPKYLLFIIPTIVAVILAVVAFKFFKSRNEIQYTRFENLPANE